MAEGGRDDSLLHKQLVAETRALCLAVLLWSPVLSIGLRLYGVGGGFVDCDCTVGPPTDA